MGNIMDYISWRGDLSFEQSQFNEVDNLILACFSYVNLDGISAVTKQKGIGLKKLTKEFMKLHTMKELEADKSFIRLAPFMMFEMAKSVRFGKCVIRNYVNEIVTEAEQQFSAVEIVLDDGTSYISFRGTDDTIIGWKEDFNLRTGVVPAQERAVEYMQRISDKAYGMLRVGGHSKGGNLAIYGSVMCKSAHDKILEIYSNDGPGFSKEFQESPETAEMMPKIIRIIPEYSIIGTLLEHEKQPIIVASTSRGLLQHDGFSWQVMGDHFVTLRQVSRQAHLSDLELRTWVHGMPVEQRENFVNALFDVLTASGAVTLTDLKADHFKAVGAAVKAMKDLDKETRDGLLEFMRILFMSNLRLTLEGIQEESEKKRGVLRWSRKRKREEAL